MADFLDDSTFKAELAGKKAQQLSLLLQAGFAVPLGFVIAHEESLDGYSDEQLQAMVARAGGFPVAVRSSGALEDLAGASFAGQYETFLSVGDIATLRSSIVACRLSGTSDRVKTYLRKQGLPEDQAKVAVLVQRMVDAEIAGVAFSLDPVTGREEHGLVECCLGLGEKLVSGHVTPSRYVLDLPTGAAVEETLGSESAKLSPEHQRELSSELLKIQARFAAPQDVEWAIDRSGKLWILQARPITKVQWRTDIDEYTNADFKDGGISARVSTPLMLSLYRNAFQPTMQRYMTDIKLLRKKDPPLTWYASYYGRAYWSASAVKSALARVPGFDEKTFDQDLGIQKDYGSAGPKSTPSTLLTILPAIPVALALERQYKLQLATAQQFGAGFARELRRYLDKIDAFATTSDKDFFADFDRVLFEFHAHTEQSYFTTIYNNVNAQSDFKQFVAGVDKATGGSTAITVLMSGLTNVSHMEMQRGIVALYKVASASGFDSESWKAELGRFLETNGFHADAELDLTVPRWGEIPERVTEMIGNMVRAGTKPADPDTTAQVQGNQFDAERERTLERIRQSFFWRLRFERGFLKHLARVRTYLTAREQMREYSSQCYAVVRRYVLEAGRRLQLAGRLPSEFSIFMLSIEEIREFLGGTLGSGAAALVNYRQQMYEGYRLFQPPNELGRGLRSRDEASYVQQGEGGVVLKGLGCSPGRVEGVARVLTSLDDAHLLQPNDILVTRFTDPGWTPVLGVISGVVTEVGGLLSHAAVIGREYGIPAVLNLPGATKALRSGQRIRIDGTSGLVEIINAEA